MSEKKFRSFKIELPDGSTKTITASAKVTDYIEHHGEPRLPGERMTEVDDVQVENKDWFELKDAIIEVLEQSDAWFEED